MSTNPATRSAIDVCIGELIWAKYSEPNQRDRQKKALLQLADAAGTGIILDCSLVEVGNSEIVNLLMQIRNHTKKQNKHIVLFNVPECLGETIKLCNLNSVLPSVADPHAAKELIGGLSRGKGSLRMWVESHLALTGILVVAACVLIGIAGYLIFG